MKNPLRFVGIRRSAPAVQKKKKKKKTKELLEFKPTPEKNTGRSNIIVVNIPVKKKRY